MVVHPLRVALGVLDGCEYPYLQANFPREFPEFWVVQSKLPGGVAGGDESTGNAINEHHFFCAHESLLHKRVHAIIQHSTLSANTYSRRSTFAAIAIEWRSVRPTRWS